jgi:hypothetical protein
MIHSLKPLILFKGPRHQKKVKYREESILQHRIYYICKLMTTMTVIMVMVFITSFARPASLLVTFFSV